VLLSVNLLLIIPIIYFGYYVLYKPGYLLYFYVSPSKLFGFVIETLLIFVWLNIVKYYRSTDYYNFIRVTVLIFGKGTNII